MVNATFMNRKVWLVCLDLRHEEDIRWGVVMSLVRLPTTIKRIVASCGEPEDVG